MDTPKRAVEPGQVQQGQKIMKAYSECIGMTNKDSEECKAAKQRGGESVKLLTEKHREEGMDIIDMGW